MKATLEIFDKHHDISLITMPSIDIDNEVLSVNLPFEIYSETPLTGFSHEAILHIGDTCHLRLFEVNMTKSNERYIVKPSKITLHNYEPCFQHQTL